MAKFIAILVGIGILVYAMSSWMGSSAALPADPLTASATLDLKVKAQANVAVQVTSLGNRMKLAMAGNNDPGLRGDLAKLHQDVLTARSQLTTLGDSEAAIDQWMSNLRWSEFLALENEYTKSLANN